MTIHRRLLIDLLLLMLFAGATILVATWIAGAKTTRELSSALIEQTVQRTENELQQFFGEVQSNVLAAREWAASGMLDATDHEAMNRLFVPILNQHPQLSSMMVADSDGAEFLLLRDPLDANAWSNRVVQADHWGTRVLQRTWNTATGELNEYYEELDYDPRRRIWYERALEATPEAPLYWTKPVIFFITKDPGITASAHWPGDASDSATTVVAFDLLLMDVSRFTSKLEVSDRGKAFVLTEDQDSGEFQVVGLPPDESYGNDAAIRNALVFVPPESAVADADAQLPPPDGLETPVTSDGLRAWLQGDRSTTPVSFSSLGERWWGGFQPYPLGENTFWIGVVVPESDLSAGIRRQQIALMGIVMGVLVIGVFRASVLARRFSAPIERLVQQSEQISEGALEAGTPITSDVSEIRRLAQAHEKMREGVKSIIKLEKLERDLDIARDIQRGLLPDEEPVTPGFLVGGWNRPADKTGGDFFDWLTLPDGRTLFTLADVTGHGIGPALLTAVYRAYIRAAAADGRIELADVVARVSELLSADIPEGRFITAAFGLIHPEEHLVELVSAGQAPLLFYESATGVVHNWDADDLPLGVTDAINPERTRKIRFESGDVLALMTDGFFEASNAADEQFGTAAVEEFLRERHALAPREFIAELYDRVKSHAGDQEQGDDLTALVVKRVDD